MEAQGECPCRGARGEGPNCPNHHPGQPPPNSLLRRNAAARRVHLLQRTPGRGAATSATKPRPFIQSNPKSRPPMCAPRHLESAISSLGRTADTDARG